VSRHRADLLALERGGRGRKDAFDDLLYQKPVAGNMLQILSQINERGRSEVATYIHSAQVGGNHYGETA